MSLNTIELADLIVTELYPNSLLATEAASSTAARASVAKIPVGPDLLSGSAPVTATPPDPVTSSVSPVARTTNPPETKSPQPALPGADQPVAPDTQQTGKTGTSQPIPVAKQPDPNQTALPGGKLPGASQPDDPYRRQPSGASQTPHTVANQPVGSSAPFGPGTAPVTRTSPPPGSDGGGYKVLGNNRRQITVLVQSPGVAFLADDQLGFLTRMLEACKMNVGDVAIVNMAGAVVTITALKQQLQPRIILLFGMEPVAIKLPMTFPWFKIHTYDECTFLCAPSLEQLVLQGDESKLLKSKLWMCLKTLFGI